MENSATKWLLMSRSSFCPRAAHWDCAQAVGVSCPFALVRRGSDLWASNTNGTCSRTTLTGLSMPTIPVTVFFVLLFLASLGFFVQKPVGED